MDPVYDRNNVQLYCGDALEVLRELPDNTVHCCITSPPYFGLRDYGIDGQIGLEETPEEYVVRLVEVFREVRRVLHPAGTLWLNLGDSYAGSWGNYHPNSPPGKHGQRLKNTARWNREAYRDQNFRPPTAGLKCLKPKDLVGIPWRVALALQADGWWLRQDLIWHKSNCMPESVKDRCTKAHEYLFLLARSERYYFDPVSIQEPVKDDTAARYKRGRSDNHKWADGGPGNQTIACTFSHMSTLRYRNKRSVWDIPSSGYPEAHFATFPAALVEPCILAGTSKAGCCSHCGAPWERVVKAWRPACDCGGEPVPCVVLDPFSGAGTTVMVAATLGRKAIGIELNPDYLQMSTKRLNTAQLRMFA